MIGCALFDRSGKPDGTLTLAVTTPPTVVLYASRVYVLKPNQPWVWPLRYDEATSYTVTD